MLWILFAFYVCLVVFDAIGDATRNNRKIISHLFQSLFLALALLLVIYYPGRIWIDHIMILILWYGVNRLLLFDIAWNITHNLCNKRDDWVTIDYIGGTGIWDISVRWVLIKMRMPSSYWLFLRFCIWVGYNAAILRNYTI
jgi:hypothetical protein